MLMWCAFPQDGGGQNFRRQRVFFTYGDVSFGGAMESFNKGVPRKEGYPALGGTFDWPRKGSSGHGFGRELRDPI